ncbi:MAG: glycosyltransferase [Bacteroidales bacterium]|nr:glycosyltransferase [Bacteroidales bacterium]
MRYLFIVQGEGRGHLTQAMTLERLLLGAGHEVAGILVGKSPSRILPAFFREGVHSPVEQFESMNFVPSSNNRKPDYAKTGLYNFLNLSAYLPSVKFLVKKIKTLKPDVIVNLYDTLGTNAYNLSRYDAPMVCIGHQFLFTHGGFRFPVFGYEGHVALNMFSEMVSLRAAKVLSLSFRNMPSDGKNHVVPPLLRPEVLDASPSQGDFIHGYLLNAGFAQDVTSWHEKHPEVPLRFFWDRPDEVVDATLSFHSLDDKAFLAGLAGCRVYASTAGFESICEAMYLSKPLLMVPSHIEQRCNAFDATFYGRKPGDNESPGPRPACTSDHFDLDLLLDFAKNDYSQDPDFKSWVDSAPGIFLRELTDFS